MTAPTVTRDISELVRALPEVYQSIYGHQEFDGSAARACEDRLVSLIAIHDRLRASLGRPVRVLDLGCAQGYFSIALATRGAIVAGVDFSAENIALCQALADEHPDADLSFTHGTVEEVIGTMAPGSVDLVLGLSVFHHLVHEHGVPAIRALLTRLAERVAVGVFEMALATEPLYWGPSQPDDPRELLAGWSYMATNSHCVTHLSDVVRPLIVARGHAPDGGFWADTPRLAADVGFADGMWCIPSVQARHDGEPRFRVFAPETATSAVSEETDGGIEPSIRLFMDAQLEPGDVVLDLTPRQGFVALGCASHGAKPRVYCAVAAGRARDDLARSARTSGVTLHFVADRAALSDAAQALQDVLLLGARVFVHSGVHDVLAWGPSLREAAEAGRVIAWCVGGADAVDNQTLTTAHDLLRDIGFAPMVLGERDGEFVLLDAPADATELIAVHTSARHDAA